VGKSSFATLGELSLVDTIITDSNISKEDKELYQSYNLKCIIAQI
jgi:DeoR/GlpR family transcriptional regulator of sugar metabolism